MIKRLIKTIGLENGRLYCVVGAKRFCLAECEPKIEIYEHSTHVNSVGAMRYSVKKRHITIVLCENPELTREVDEEFFRGVIRFELTADMQRTDGVFEVIRLDNLIPNEIDLDGEWQFELAGQNDIVKHLLEI